MGRYNLIGLNGRDIPVGYGSLAWKAIVPRLMGIHLLTTLVQWHLNYEVMTRTGGGGKLFEPKGQENSVGDDMWWIGVKGQVRAFIKNIQLLLIYFNLGLYNII